jgi:hypothetical protein
MPKATYRGIAGPCGHLARCEPFVGNTMSARFVTDSVSGHKLYRVFSYSTCIGQYDMDTGEKLVPDQRYSVTTSKHQGYTRAWLGHQAWWHEATR